MKLKEIVSFRTILQMERVAHPVFLCLQIPQVEGIGRYLYGNILHDLESVSLQTDTFHRIIGEQAHFLYTGMNILHNRRS